MFIPNDKEEEGREATSVSREAREVIIYDIWEKGYSHKRVLIYPCGKVIDIVYRAKGNRPFI